MSNNALWLGQKGAELLVFDPSIQVSQSDLVLLWSAESEQMEAYVSSKIRENISKANVDSKPIAERYYRWREAHKANIEEERRELESRLERDALERKKRAQRIEEKIFEELQLLSEEERAQRQAAFASMSVEEKHAFFLKERNLPPARIRKALPKKRRVTHCYACRASLDNATDIECTECEWIICTKCGACGCGYVGNI